MEREQLREDLERLHRELASGVSLDPESRRMLADLARQIEAVLERGERGDDTSLVENLRSATERFEESHPALTAVVGRIADLLSRMGI